VGTSCPHRQLYPHVPDGKVLAPGTFFVLPPLSSASEPLCAATSEFRTHPAPCRHRKRAAARCQLGGNRVRNRVDRHEGFSDLHRMLRRLTICLLVSCGLFASLFAPSPMAQEWTVGCSIAAMGPVMPVETSERSSREIPVSSAATIHIRRQQLRIQTVVVHVIKTAPVCRLLPPLRRIPPPPEIQQISPRAPPPVC
jgi:hypothetical protein